MNFCGTRPSVEDNLHWKTNFGGSQHIIWELEGGKGVSNKFKGCSKVLQVLRKDFLQEFRLVLGVFPLKFKGNLRMFKKNFKEDCGQC